MHTAHVNLLTYSKFHTVTQHTWKCMVNVGHTGRCAAKSRGIQRHSMRHQGFVVSQAILKQSWHWDHWDHWWSTDQVMVNCEYRDVHQHCTSCLGQDGCNGDLAEALVVMRIGQAGLAHGNARNAHGKCHNFLDFFHPTSSYFISFHQRRSVFIISSLSRSFTTSTCTKNQTPLTSQQKW